MAHACDNRTLKHGCIIMASGMATRFGGNKLMTELGGVPLVGHVVGATDGLFDRRVVVTRHADVAALCEALGVRAILHEEPGRNDTVRLGMEAMDGCDTVMFFQGDQPLIRAASVVALLRAAERDAAAKHDAAAAAGRDAEGRDAAEDYDTERDAAESGVVDVSRRPSACIWRTSFDGMPGAPVLFPSWAFDELRSLPHGKGGGFVAKMHAEYVRTIEVSSEWELFDVDTRDDLQQLQAYVARCGM